MYRLVNRGWGTLREVAEMPLTSVLEANEVLDAIEAAERRQAQR